MTMHFVDKGEPQLGHYSILESEQGARWQWVETAKGILYEDHGVWCATVADAYRDAAADWEENGGSSNRRLAGQLRAAAKREDKKEA